MTQNQKIKDRAGNLARAAGGFNLSASDTPVDQPEREVRSVARKARIAALAFLLGAFIAWSLL